jgi:hypothetical protein
MVQTIADRWDDVIDALDALVEIPEVDAAALAVAEKEVALVEKAAEEEPVALGEGDDEGGADEGPAGFWEEVGIDPIRISTAEGDFVTLRCYLDDAPVFLGTEGRIDVFRSERALARHVAGNGAEGHDLVAASTWTEVVERAGTGDLEVVVDELNTYVLTGLDEELAEDTQAVDASRLELATELLLDVGEWAGDDEPREALAENQPLGWLVSFIIRPDPTRLAPRPPFEAEAAKWRELVDDLTERLTVH